MKQHQAMYNELLHFGFIPPILTEYEKKFFEDNQKPENTVTDTELLNLAFNSKTAQRREHSFNAYRPDEVWKSGDVVELARIAVPSGMLGILRRIDTLVTDDTTGEPITEWNNPDSWNNIFRFVLSYNIPGDQKMMGARMVDIPAAARPADEWPRWIQSTPLPPTLSWTDDRYAWGNPSNDIGVAIPKECILRLFVCCISETNFRHSLRGRLVITTQLEKSLSAAWRARRGNIG